MMNRNGKQMWQKKNFIANITLEHTLRVYRQSDIYDTARACLGSCKTLFPLKIILQKYSFFVRTGAFLVGGKNKLYICRKICSFGENTKRQPRKTMV